MSDSSLPVVDERSKRNAKDIQQLWRESNEQGKEIARMGEQLGNLEKGQEEAKQERTRQGGVLDKIATKLEADPDHSHDSGPPPAAVVAPGLLASIPWYLKVAVVTAMAIGTAAAAYVAKLTGYTPLP